MGENTCLSPFWPGFDSWTCCYMRVGVVGSPRCGGVSPGPPVPLVFLPPQIPILCYCVQTIALIHIYFSLVWYFLYCEG